MGQYYKPINLNNGQWLNANDYGNGLKLTEHSWIGNDFLGAVMQLMVKGGPWNKEKIVWCGDYFDEEGEEDYYDKVKDKDKIKPSEKMKEKEQNNAVLINHTKKQYVLFSKQPGVDEDGWKQNPLPLLTALGNGRGLGDYHGLNEDKIGIWARDELSIGFEGDVKLEGFTELEVIFNENHKV
jgi:hypothetical protein